MKVTLPSQVPIKWVLSFVLVLVLVLMLQGNTALLACTAAAFIVLSAIAFNVAGGLQYPSGAYIFFNALLSAILGIVLKAALGEPLNTNLTDAQYTLGVYVTGMCALLVASVLNRRFRRRSPLLRNTLSSARMDQVGLGCVILSILLTYVVPQSAMGTVSQFNRLGTLAILLTVSQKVKDTDGRRSFTWVAFVAWFFSTASGLLAFSKEGMFSSSVAWGVAAIASGYRLTWRRAVVLVGIVVPAVFFLTPVSQVGRVYNGTGVSPFATAADLLSHPVQTRELYERTQVDRYLDATEYHWFDKPQGLLDRLTMVPIDDALIYATDHGHPGSLEAVWSYFVNVIPRYLYPEKPTLHWGNIYGHEVGLLGEGDDTTGISFSPYADAYHTGLWLGDTLVICGMFFMLFFVCDSLTGSVMEGPWALLYVAAFAHQAAEGLLSALVYMSTTYSLAVIAAQMVATYVAPVVGAFAIAPKRTGFAEPAPLPGTVP